MLSPEEFKIRPICEVCGSVAGKVHKKDCPLTPKPLRWKRVTKSGRQDTHCGRYYVEQERADCEVVRRWHPHRSDLDEALSFDYFETREEAKKYCESDNQEFG